MEEGLGGWCYGCGCHSGLEREQEKSERALRGRGREEKGKRVTTTFPPSPVFPPPDLKRRMDSRFDPHGHLDRQRRDSCYREYSSPVMY
jgi:hypothetical protein